MTDDVSRLDSCGCCEAHGELTPLAVENRPGLSELAYRVGTHGTFKETMLSRLAEVEPDSGAGRPLGRLSTREDDDPTIGLIDAWACVLDVLTFYQERIANEGFLRTATEQRSIHELAHSIGYELKPGTAATAYLAFELETAAGAPQSVTIDPGVKVQSLPGPGEVPQTFETVEEIEARPEWNAMRPKATTALKSAVGATDVFLAGRANVKQGDMLLFIGDDWAADAPGSWIHRRIESVEVGPGGDRTHVRWTEGLDWWLGEHVIGPSHGNLKVYVFRTRAALFGANAPDTRALPSKTTKGRVTPTGEWSNLTLAGISGVSPFDDTVYLDAIYPQIVRGSWVALADGQNVEVYAVLEAAEDSRTDFTLSAKTTRLKLSGPNLEFLFGSSVRAATVWGGSEQLEVAATPIDEPIGGTASETIELDEAIPRLPAGRPVVVSGKKPVGSTDDDLTSEIVWTAEPPTAALTQTELYLKAPLKGTYDRASVRIAANVVFATQGETRKEILGSGDAGTPFQRFKLSASPLTYVPSADSPTGGTTTLLVRVNGLQWHEQRALYGCGPRDRAYTVRIDDEGKAAVAFGNGKMGARLPSGVENVEAHYRAGAGLAGMVKEGQLSLLTNPPLGVTRVSNPFAATGASNPETSDRARAHAPLTVRTLDRTVSLDDFEAFAAAFAGIGKAQASWLWDKERRLIVLTIAADGGGTLDAKSVTFGYLSDALAVAGEPRRHVVLRSYEPLEFKVGALAYVDPDFEKATVVQAAEAAVRETFAFDRRAFAEPVARSEVEATIQAVAGVVAVELTKLHVVGGFGVRTLLTASGAQLDGDDIRGAQLLQLAPDGITVAAA